MAGRRSADVGQHECHAPGDLRLRLAGAAPDAPHHGHRDGSILGEWESSARWAGWKIRCQVGADAREYRNVRLRNDKALPGDGLVHLDIDLRSLENDIARDR